MASITLRNNDSVDIHASKISTGKVFAIQVKTKQIDGYQWPLSVKAEKKYAKNLFYVFVTLKGLSERPIYHIVPSVTVAKRISERHQSWLETPGKKGQKHNDSTLRTFIDSDMEFAERWDLLE